MSVKACKSDTSAPGYLAQSAEYVQSCYSIKQPRVLKPITPEGDKMVKYTLKILLSNRLKILQCLWQNFSRVFDHFADTRRYKY